jgi:hypothetical protein
MFLTFQRHSATRNPLIARAPLFEMWIARKGTFASAEGRWNTGGAFRMPAVLLTRALSGRPEKSD